VIQDPDKNDDANHDEPIARDDGESTTLARSGSRSRSRLAGLLAVLCTLALVGGIVLFFWLQGRTEEISNAEEDRIEALQAAERFTVEWNTFRPNEVDDYIDRVTPLLSSKFKGEFTNAAPDVVEGITQQRLFSKGEVLRDGDGVPLVGISTIDADSAEVLVVSDANRVANRQRVLRHWRWQVSLVKVDGDWLVDSFKEV
jgi:hypothetical protein